MSTFSSVASLVNLSIVFWLRLVASTITFKLRLIAALIENSSISEI